MGSHRNPAVIISQTQSNEIAAAMIGHICAIQRRKPGQNGCTPVRITTAPRRLARNNVYERVSTGDWSFETRKWITSAMMLAAGITSRVRARKPEVVRAVRAGGAALSAGIG